MFEVSKVVQFLGDILEFLVFLVCRQFFDTVSSVQFNESQNILPDLQGTKSPVVLKAVSRFLSRIVFCGPLIPTLKFYTDHFAKECLTILQSGENTEIDFRDA